MPKKVVDTSHAEMGCVSSKALVERNPERISMCKASDDDEAEDWRNLTGMVDIAICLKLEDILMVLSRILKDKVVKISSVYRSVNGTTRTIQTISGIDTNGAELQESPRGSQTIKTDISDLMPNKETGQYQIYSGLKTKDVHKSVVNKVVRITARKIMENGLAHANANKIIALLSQDKTLKIVWNTSEWESIIGKSEEFWKVLSVTHEALSKKRDGEDPTTDSLVRGVFENGGMSLPMTRRMEGQKEVAVLVYISPLIHEAEIGLLACQVHAILNTDANDVIVDENDEDPNGQTMDGDTKDSLFDSIRMGTLIGKGGFGSVYRAILDGRIVALKVLDGVEPCMSIDVHLPVSSEMVGEKEIEVGGRLFHENVIKTIDYATRTIEGREQTWIVLEFCESGSLRQLIEDHYFDSSKNLIRVAKEIATGMSYLHSQQIIHGDLSSNNVLFDKGFTAKISDFGLSRDFAGVTVITSALGTTCYMAPELLSSGKLNKAGDVYSYGIILLEMLTGKRAFSGMRYVEVITSKLADESGLLLESIPSDAPHVMRELITECTRTEYNSRPSFDRIVSRFHDMI